VAVQASKRFLRLVSSVFTCSQFKTRGRAAQVCARLRYVTAWLAVCLPGLLNTGLAAEAQVAPLRSVEPEQVWAERVRSLPPAVEQIRTPVGLGEVAAKIAPNVAMDGVPQLGAADPKAGRSHPRIPRKYDVGLIGERGIGKGLNFYSLEKEQMLGRELAEQIERHARMFTDPVINEYVNRLGQNLVRNSDAEVPFTIRIIDSEEINAFALPGGFFYINTGLLMAAESEAELAGVMAHEIAHVAARHATKNATKSELFNLLSVPLIFVGGPVGYAVQQAVGVAVPMSFLKFSRNAEREADLLGIEYQYASGYDPQAFVQFFEKLQAKKKEKRNFLARAFSSHPMNEDRIKRSQEAIEKYLPDREQYIVTTSEFDEMKARLVELSASPRLSDLGKGAKPTLRKRVEDDEKR
jgi:hypothetical protein